MTTTPKPRRRLTDAEKVERAKSQIEMIEKRAAEKRLERAVEAHALLHDDGVLIDDRLDTAADQLRNWIDARKKEQPA